MNNKSKVIFVNSFKGGAGKTTLALMHCIDHVFHQKGQYENVIYMDLDVLGTGTCYLFGEGRLTEERCFEKTGKPQEVEIRQGEDAGSIHVAYLNPELKNRSVFGTDYFINHQSMAAELLKDKILRFMEEQIKKVPGTLLVLDCAPGFSSMEQALLQECYCMMMQGKIEVEEDYVTTLDSSHMQKCIQCLNGIADGIPIDRKYRNVNIVINDLQNYSGYVDETAPGSLEEKWNDIISKIRRNLHDGPLAVIRWKYSQEFAQQSIYGSESAVENHPEWYIFTDENYQLLYSTKDREMEK